MIIFVILRLLWLVVSVGWVAIVGQDLFMQEEFNIISKEYIFTAIGCAVLAAPVFAKFWRLTARKNGADRSWAMFFVMIVVGVMISPIMLLVAMIMNIKSISQLLAEGKAEKRRLKAERTGERSFAEDARSLSELPDNKRRYLMTVTTALEKILDEENEEDVFIDDGEKSLRFRQRGTMKSEDGNLYAFLNPILPDVDEETVVVYEIGDDPETGWSTLLLVTDEEEEQRLTEEFNRIFTKE